MKAELQLLIVLKWVVMDSSVADIAYSKGCKIKKDEIKTMEEMTDGIRDDAFKSSKIKKHFTRKGYATLVVIKKGKEKIKWNCGTCNTEIKPHENSVCCEKCLLWSHFSCTGILKNIKNKPWFCSQCKRTHQNCN